MLDKKIPDQIRASVTAKPSGNVRVIARFTTTTIDGSPAWGDYQIVELFVAFRQQTIKRGRGVRTQLAGEIIGLLVLDFDWAEYTEQDYEGDGIFLVDNHRMEIKQVLQR